MAMGASQLSSTIAALATLVSRVFRLRTLGALALLPALLSGCVPPIDVAEPGKVTGRLMIFWIAEDQFVYYPFPGDPLTYHLPPAMAARLGTESIRPGAIYTDGGSIPRAVRGWAGFSPWGYGPAYIVHDWLFVAHHCIVTDQTAKHDPRDLAEVETVRKVDFTASANILAGVIEALIVANRVPRRDFAPGAIYTAVDSGIARRLWDSKDPAGCDPLPPDKIQEIETALRSRTLRTLEAPPGTRAPVLVVDQTY